MIDVDRWIQLGEDVLAGVRNQFRPCPKPLAFVHIEKCAGISLMRALSRCYQTPLIRRTAYIDHEAAVQAALGGERCRFDLSERKQVDDFSQKLALYYMKKGNPLVQGHFSFRRELFEECLEKYRFITVLRDPVDRWTSPIFSG